MAGTASSKKHQSDTGYMEAGLGVDKSSTPLMDLHFNRNKVSRLRGWHTLPLPRHEDTVAYIHVPSQATFICIQLSTY
jgi:hypothetical protein